MRAAEVLADVFLALALGQLSTKVLAFQWIFALIITVLLVVLSTVIGVPGLVGKSNADRPHGIVSEDRERAPLLEDT